MTKTNRNTIKSIRSTQKGYRPTTEGYRPAEAPPLSQSRQPGPQQPKPPAGGTGQSAPRSNVGNKA